MHAIDGVGVRLVCSDPIGSLWYLRLQTNPVSITDIAIKQIQELLPSSLHIYIYIYIYIRQSDHVTCRIHSLTQRHRMQSGTLFLQQRLSMGSKIGMHVASDFGISFCDPGGSCSREPLPRGWGVGWVGTKVFLQLPWSAMAGTEVAWKHSSTVPRFQPVCKIRMPIAKQSSKHACTSQWIQTCLRNTSPGCTKDI